MDAIQYFAQYYKEDKNKKLHRFCPRCGTPLISEIIEDRLRPFCARCGYIQYLNPSPGAVVLIEQENSILIGKRCGRVLAGQWSLPGGFINFNETFLTAAHREVMEETGFHIQITSILSVVSNFINPSLHTLVIVLKAHVSGGQPCPGDDLNELKWITRPEDMPNMAFESDKHIIRRYFEDRNFGAPVDPDQACSPFG